MKAKKCWALILAVLLTIGCFSACADTPAASGAGSSTVAAGETSTAVNTDETDPFAETVKLSIGFWGSEKLGGDELWNDYIVPKFNVDFDYIQMDFSDYVEKVRLLAASDELPDICVSPGRTDYFSYSEQGLLKALPDDLSDYPELEAYLDTPSLPFYYIDGKLYGIPRGGGRNLNNAFAGSFYMVRKDWMEQAGYEEFPTEWEEFFTMAQDVMALNPDGISNLVGIAGSTTEILDPMKSSLSKIGEGFQLIDGQWAPAEFNKEDNIPWLELGRKAYQMGVIDKNFALDDASVAKDKILAGQAFCGMLYMTAADMQSLAEQFESANPGKSAEECIGFYLPPNGFDGKPHAIYSAVNIGTMFSAKMSDEQMDRTLRFIDWILTDEGQTMLNLGEKDKDYTLEGETFTSLLPENPATGKQYTYEEKYPSCIIKQLVTWGGDWAKVSPTVDKTYRDIYNDAEAYVMENATYAEYNYEVAWTKTDAMSKWNYMADFEQGFVKIIMGTDNIGAMYDSIIEDTLAKGGKQALAELNEVLAAKTE